MDSDGEKWEWFASEKGRMMMIRSFTASIFVIAIFVPSCDKEEKFISIEDGTYKGLFIVTYRSGAQTGQATLELKNGRFLCSGNVNRIPAGGSGTYSSDNGKITFYDENFWTADFDWNLILNGQYDFIFNGKDLILSADKNDVGKYEYELKKQ